MRKYVIGIIIGASLMFSVQAGAAALFGSVDGVIQVKVDGENMGQAPVIDGVSYLPVRKLADKAGYKVDFGEGVATLTTTSAVPVGSPVATIPELTDPVATGAPPQPTHNFTLETIDSAIIEYEGSIKIALVNVNSVKGIDAKEDARLEAGMQKMYQELDRLKAIKVELQAK